MVGRGGWVSRPSWVLRYYYDDYLTLVAAPSPRQLLYYGAIDILFVSFLLKFVNKQRFDDGEVDRIDYVRNERQGKKEQLHDASNDEHQC